MAGEDHNQRDDTEQTHPPLVLEHALGNFLSTVLLKGKQEKFKPIIKQNSNAYVQWVEQAHQLHIDVCEALQTPCARFVVIQNSTKLSSACSLIPNPC